MLVVVVVAMYCADNVAAKMSSPGRTTVRTEVCIYGGTSAAVTAAKAAAQEGCKVLVICPDTVLGGMTTGGLGATDIGNKEAIIGMARQFYRDLGAYYGKDEQWTFEPSVAQRIIDSYVEHENISLYLGYYLESVQKKGTRIVSITCAGKGGGLRRCRAGVRSLTGEDTHEQK